MSEPHKVSEPPKIWTEHFEAEVTEVGEMEMTGAAGVILEYPDNEDEREDAKRIAKIELPIPVLRMMGGVIYDKIGVTLSYPPTGPSDSKDIRGGLKAREEQLGFVMKSLSTLREHLAAKDDTESCQAIDEITMASEKWDTL